VVGAGPSGQVRVIPCRCRTRGCALCDRGRGVKMRKRLEAAMQNGCILVTLTYRHETGESPPDSFSRARAAWRSYWDRLTKAMPYLRRAAWAMVYEPHRSGLAHIHQAIAIPWAPLAAMRLAWNAALGSAEGNVDVRKIPGWRGARYVAKYVTKASAWPADVLQLVYERSWRMMSTSRRVPPEPPRDAGGWTWIFVGGGPAVVELAAQVMREASAYRARIPT
jgi:hypothetical protein